MKENRKKSKKISLISTLHFAKLVFRSLLFVAAAVLYIVNRQKNTGETFGGMEDGGIVLLAIWLIFFVEMILRFFPSRTESMGCQKQFEKNYIPTGCEEKPKEFPMRTFLCALFWILLNAGIGALYYTGVIDAGILVLVALAYAVCDMVCILFFCPFQTWILKNKCCTTCRIYNWDYAMMMTPLVFIKNPYTISIVIGSVLLLLRWEISYRLHPEYFHESTNKSLHCAECKEKLCMHKTQLRTFWQKNRAVLTDKYNTLASEVKKVASSASAILKKEDKKEDKKEKEGNDGSKS